MPAPPSTPPLLPPVCLHPASASGLALVVAERAGPRPNRPILSLLPPYHHHPAPNCLALGPWTSDLT